MSAVRTELTAGTWTANPASTRAGLRARDVLGRSVHSLAVDLIDLIDLINLDDGAQVRATATLDRRLVGITEPRLLVGRRLAVRVDAVLHASGA